MSSRAGQNARLPFRYAAGLTAAAAASSSAIQPAW